MYFIREKDTIKIATYPLHVFTHIHKHIHLETHIYAFNKYTPIHAHGRIHRHLFLWSEMYQLLLALLSKKRTELCQLGSQMWKGLCNTVHCIDSVHTQKIEVYQFCFKISAEEKRITLKGRDRKTELPSATLTTAVCGKPGAEETELTFVSIVSHDSAVRKA